MLPYELDIHTHTIASGHATHNTVTDMLKKASATGLKLLGICEHGPATACSCKPAYFQGLALARRNRMGLEILFGAELNIMDDFGTFDLDDSVSEKLDYCLAAMHFQVRKPGSKSSNTMAYLNAMKKPYVKIIAHCADIKYEVDLEALAEAAVKQHVLLEINNSSLSPGGYRGDTREDHILLLELLKSRNYPVILSSDSHGTGHIGDFRYAQKLLTEAAYPQDLVLNHSVNDFKAFINTKKNTA